MCRSRECLTFGRPVERRAHQPGHSARLAVFLIPDGFFSGTNGGFISDLGFSSRGLHTLEV